MAVAMRKSSLTPELDGLTGRIVSAAMEVHLALGPGLLEGVYQSALSVVLTRLEIPHVREYRCSLFFEGVPIGELRLDLVVDRRVVVEVKALEVVAQVHRAQVLTYLRATSLVVGLLINFGTELLQVKRVLLTSLDPPPNHRSPEPSC